MITVHTDGHTDKQTQATTIPEGQNWHRVKQVNGFSLKFSGQVGLGTRNNVKHFGDVPFSPLNMGCFSLFFWANPCLLATLQNKSFSEEATYAWGLVVLN